MSSSRRSRNSTSYSTLAVGTLALVDRHPVEARRQRFHRLEHRDDLRVFLLRDLAGDEDPEVAHILVQQADDDLAARLDLLGRTVDVGHPVEGLLRRGDVVAHRGEQDDRHLDVAQIETLARPVGRVAFPQLVADEQIAGDPFDLFAVHQEEATPPALEFEEARRLGIDLCVEVVVLVPERVGRIQVLEVLDEVGAVEDARAAGRP